MVINIDVVAVGLCQRLLWGMRKTHHVSIENGVLTRALDGLFDSSFNYLIIVHSSSPSPISIKSAVGILVFGTFELYLRSFHPRSSEELPEKTRKRFD